MPLFKSAGTVGGLTLISRIFGYVRDILVAAILGAGPMADAFFVAFRLPNFFRTLSAEGAFNAAFIPLFSGKLSAEGKSSALHFAEKAFSIMTCVLLLLIIVMEIFMPWVMRVLAPGFIDNPEQFDLTVALARITFPYLIFISLVSLFGGMLNSFGKFAAPAAAPIILNLCMIAGLVMFSHYFQTPAHVLVWSIAVAGFLQLAWILYSAYRIGAVLHPKKPKIDKDVKILLRRMVPGIISGGVVQINVWINTIIATLIPGAVSYLYYADRFVQFPLAIIGTAMGVALLPALSAQFKKNDKEGAIATQNKALEMVLFFILPAAVALFVISHPIISVLFERGAFTSKETLATSYALSAYALGLPAFVLIKVFLPGFFAVGDTKTPVKIALISMIVNVILNLILIQYIGHVGLAISTSIASWLNVYLLHRLLIKRGLYHTSSRVSSVTPKMVICSLLTGLALWWLHIALIDYSLSSSFTHRALELGILVFAGGGLYFILSHLTKACTTSDLLRMVKG